MKTSTKLSSEERREVIIIAARRIFAEKGFHGTTTRDLATAAGVSEALCTSIFRTKKRSSRICSCHATVRNTMASSKN